MQVQIKEWFISKKLTELGQAKAYAVKVLGVKGDKDKEVEKAKKVEKIKVCFTLSENPIAKSGAKEIFLRIESPEGKVLTTSPFESRVSFLVESPLHNRRSRACQSGVREAGALRCIPKLLVKAREWARRSLAPPGWGEAPQSPSCRRGRLMFARA